MKKFLVPCVVALILMAEVNRMEILRRLGAGIPVSEYESRLSQFLQILSFLPVGLGMGISMLLIPKRISAWYHNLLNPGNPIYSPWEVFALRLFGLLFIVFTLRALWDTSQFLVR
jgi:hypothetical protein